MRGHGGGREVEREWQVHGGVRSKRVKVRSRRVVEGVGNGMFGSLAVGGEGGRERHEFVKLGQQGKT